MIKEIKLSNQNSDNEKDPSKIKMKLKRFKIKQKKGVLLAKISILKMLKKTLQAEGKYQTEAQIYRKK